jgi:hypothetical protein
VAGADARRAPGHPDFEKSAGAGRDRFACAEDALAQDLQIRRLGVENMAPDQNDSPHVDMNFEVLN